MIAVVVAVGTVVVIAVVVAVGTVVVIAVVVAVGAVVVVANDAVGAVVVGAVVVVMVDVGIEVVCKVIGVFIAIAKVIAVVTCKGNFFIAAAADIVIVFAIFITATVTFVHVFIVIIRGCRDAIVAEATGSWGSCFFVTSGDAATGSESAAFDYIGILDIRAVCVVFEFHTAGRGF